MADSTERQNNQNRRKKNHDYLWKFYAYTGIAGLAFGLFTPVLSLFLLDRGYNLAGIGVISGVINFSRFALEVPTGIVADKFSRKWSVSLGLIFQAISLFFFVTTTNFLVLIGGPIFFAVGMTLNSGADSALLYDSLKSDGREAAFHKSIGNAISLRLAGIVAGNLLCGICIRYVGLSAPLWAGSVIYLLVATLPAMIREPSLLQESRSKGKALTLKDQVSSYSRHVKESFRFIRGSSALIFLIFINAVFVRMLVQLQFEFAQPYLKSLAYSPEQISYLFAIFFVISALLAKFSATVKKYLGDKERRVFLLIVLVGAASLCAYANAPIGLVAVLAVIGLNLARGIFLPFIQDSLNRRIPSDKRASCLSLASAGQALLGVISPPLFLHLADVFSLKTSLIIFQWTFFSLLLVGVIWGWKALGKAPESETVAQ